MIQIIKANTRHYSDFDWLKTFWLFSFSDYYDENNLQFGNIRVFNDDIVKSKKGFPGHDHANMEIVSIVLEGEMTHEDSMGHKTILKAGDVQIMSAGLGITHSEYNDSLLPVHFYQIWIMPSKMNLEPKYSQKNFSTFIKKNNLNPLVTSKGIEQSLAMHADANIYLGNAEKDHIIECASNPLHGIFIYVTKGKLQIDSKILENNDQARISGEKSLIVKALDDAEFILVDTHLQ